LGICDWWGTGPHVPGLARRFLDTRGSPEDFSGLDSARAGFTAFLRSGRVIELRGLEPGLRSSRVGYVGPRMRQRVPAFPRSPVRAAFSMKDDQAFDFHSASGVLAFANTHWRISPSPLPADSCSTGPSVKAKENAKDVDRLAHAVKRIPNYFLKCRHAFVDLIRAEDTNPPSRTPKARGGSSVQVDEKKLEFHFAD